MYYGWHVNTDLHGGLVCIMAGMLIINIILLN